MEVEVDDAHPQNITVEEPLPQQPNNDADPIEHLEQRFTVVQQQPTVDPCTGTLIIGPGAGATGLQPRPMDLRKALPKLDRIVEDQLSKARRFAMEQTAVHVIQRQKEQQMQGGSIFSGNLAQRQRIISLMCRIYVGSINFDIREETVKVAFSPFGPIRKVDISWDTPAVKHKGFAFVEYEVPDSAQLALEQMNNYLIGGRPIKVGRPSNVPQATPMIESIIEEARPYPRVFVSNIHPQLSSKDIRSVFEAFGKVKSCDIIGEGNPRHKGYAYIEYDGHKAANDAITAMNMFELGGQFLRVGKAVTLSSHLPEDKGLPAAAALAMAAVSAKLQAAQIPPNYLAASSTILPSRTSPGSGDPKHATTKFDSTITATNTTIPPINNLISAISSPAMVQAGLSNVAATLVSSAAIQSMITPSTTTATTLSSPSSSSSPSSPTTAAATALQSKNDRCTGVSKSKDSHKPRRSSSSSSKKGSEKSDKKSASSPTLERDSHKESTRKISHDSRCRKQQQQHPKSEKITKVDDMEIEDELDYKPVENTITAEEDVSIKGTNARFLMMRKLARNLVSSVVILRNMVGPDEADDELKGDVEHECTKYGKVSSVIINQERQGEDEQAPVVVKVFVQYCDSKDAEKAQSALNGRFFAGRCIKAEFYDEEKFQERDYSG